jgi:hypothetical protein
LAGGLQTSPLYRTVPNEASIAPSTIAASLAVGYFAAAVEEADTVCAGPNEAAGVAGVSSGDGEVVTAQTSSSPSIEEIVRALLAVVAVCEIGTERASCLVDESEPRAE